MAATDLQLTAGTTYAFGITWQTKDGDQLVPVDISGCTARFQMRDVASGELLAECKTEGDGIEIPSGPDGVVQVSVHPSKTDGLKARPIGQVAYELRVYFPSGDVYSVMSGFIAIVEGVIRD